MTNRIWTRDLDGTGSQHACLKNDPGAIEWVRVEEFEAERKSHADLHQAAVEVVNAKTAYGKAAAICRLRKVLEQVE